MQRNDYINVKEREISYHTGNVRFYGEYRPQLLEDNIVSFPLNACDPVPVETFGTAQYFFTSATQGRVPTPGEAITIDETATNVIAVRGKCDTNGHRVESYIGYNKNDFQQDGHKRIFTPSFVLLQIKNTKHVDETRKAMIIGGNLSNIHSLNISREVSRYLAGKKALDPVAPAVETRPSASRRIQRAPIDSEADKQEAMRALLGDGWMPCRMLVGGTLSNAFTNDEKILGNGISLSNKVYWTAERNELKGTTYRH